MRKASKTEKTEVVESLSVRAVKAYRQSELNLNEFMKDHEVRDILSEMYKLVEERNVLLDAAVRSVKTELQKTDHTKLTIDGIGAQKKFKRYYDTDYLAEHLPAKQADQVLTKKTVYELNEPLLEQLTRQGELDNEVVKMAYHVIEQNPASLPGTPKPWDMPPLDM
jgi:nitrogen regulatory protein PII